ncbi:MAG: sugar-transfer associated ATP-grasp domain-containing protein [Alphaproteobacteria bacterium]
MTIRDDVKYSGERVLNAAHSYFYDLRHKKEAMAAVDAIQKHNSQILTDELKKTADEYAAEIFGSKSYAPWLYVYSLIRGEFKEGWIPDNFFGKIVSPKVNKKIRVAAEFKTFSNILFRTNMLPDIGYYIDGIFYDKELARITIQDLCERISPTDGEVFVKRDGEGRGVGVMKLADHEVTEDRFRSFGNCVIQSPIRQHEFFDDIMTGSVATLRITTVKEKNGSVSLRASYLRFGRKDTSWIQSDNSVKVAITSDDGHLDSFGYTEDWRRWQSHPDSGFIFENARIPKFKEAVEAGLELHRKVPHFSVIGWDMSIDRDETVKVLEWNCGHCDIKFSEATTGPCFRGLDWEKCREA